MKNPVRPVYIPKIVSPYGYLEYFPFEKGIVIRELFIKPVYRRQGHATELVDQLSEKHKDIKIYAIVLSEEGKAFWKKYSQKNKNVVMDTGKWK